MISKSGRGSEKKADAPVSDEILAVLAARAADNNRAKNIAILDLRGISNVTDYFIIASATSRRQLKAIADNIIYAAKECGRSPLGVEGRGEELWILVDLGECVVHVFLEELREYYDIEMIWGDAGHIDWAHSKLPTEVESAINRTA